MGCKCTKSSETNNLNLQENQVDQPRQQESIENFTENVLIFFKKLYITKKILNYQTENNFKNPEIKQDIIVEEIKPRQEVQSNFTKNNKKSKKSAPLINQETEGKIKNKIKKFKFKNFYYFT